MAPKNCDLMEGIWLGQSEFKIPVTNWGNLPLSLEQGDIIACIEEAAVVGEDADVWQPISNPSVRTVKSGCRKDRLCSQLTCGDKCTETC